MKVILLKAVPKVGKPEDVVEVSEGYARNALFGRNLAVPATESALQALKKKQEGRAAEKAVHRSLLDKAIEDLKGKSLVIHAPANEKGSLFSKIDSKAITEHLLTKHRLSIDPACIHIPKEGIKKVGTYELIVKDGGYEAKLPLAVAKK